MQLEKGETGGFEAMFRHGYGAPPQALDVSSTLTTGNVIFVCEYSDGSLASSSAAAVPDGTPE
jgi:hypothetical protein